MATGGGSVWDQHNPQDGQAMGIFIGSTTETLKALSAGLKEMRDDFRKFVDSMEVYKNAQGSTVEIKSDVTNLKDRVEKLEKWQISFTAKLSAYAGLGGAAGSAVVMTISHFWK